MGYSVEIVAVGRKSEPWEHLVADYAARLRSHLSLDLRWLKPSLRSEPQARQLEEGHRLNQAVARDRLKIALDRQGEAVETLELASRFRSWRRERPRGVTFLIGSDVGLAPAVVKSVDWCWSLGPLTLPHQLARLLVVEQLYRVVTLELGIPYHRHAF